VKIFHSQSGFIRSTFKRRDIRRRIADFTGGKESSEVKRRILRALSEGKIDYLTDDGWNYCRNTLSQRR